MLRFVLGVLIRIGEMTDIESVYGAWCMKSIEVRCSKCFYKPGTEDLATVGRTIIDPQ